MMTRPTVPDLITSARLALLPPLWVAAVAGWRLPLAAGMIVAGLTDIVDGWLARRSGRVSKFGSQLDSVADMLLVGSILAWLAMLHPALFRRHGVVLLAWAALGALVLAVGWLRFRRVANLHLYSAKAAGFVGYVFAAWVIVFDGYPTALFVLAIGLAFAGTIESLLLLLTRRTVDEHAGSLLRRPRPQARASTGSAGTA